MLYTMKILMKKMDVATSVTNKLNFRARNMTHNERYFVMIQESLQQEYIILNLHVS